MTNRREKLNALFDILRRAYHQRADHTVDKGWKAAVMRRVIAAGPLRPKPDPALLFGQFVWRLAPAACAVIAVSAALLAGFDFTPQHNILTSLFTNSEEPGLVQFFQI